MPETRKKKKSKRAPSAPPRSEPVSQPALRRDRDAARAGLRFWLAPLVLAALVGLAYFNSFRGEWHLDDVKNITDNPYVRITDLAPASLLRAMVQDQRQNRFFSNLTFALNYYADGYHRWGYHLVNVALHWLAALAAFYSLRLILRRSPLPAARRDWAALAIAAIWAVHPLQTQAVTYIVQRQTVMASAFMLMSFAGYLAAREAESSRRKRLFYALAALSFVLAAGSKEIALMTPVLILIYEFYFYQNFSPAFLRRHPLALAVALALIALALAVYLRPALWFRVMQGYQFYPFSLGERLLTEPRVLWQYLGLILWPLASRISLYHDPGLSTSLVSPWTTLPAILGWVVILAAALRFAPRYPLLSFAALWYLLNLFLESSFIPLDLMFEHRIYLPSLAVIALVCSGSLLAVRRVQWAWVGLGLIAAAFLLGTCRRNPIWETEFGLYTDCVRKNPFQARTYNGRGNALWARGETDRAIVDYNKALALNPKFAEAFYNRGTAYNKRGDVDRAIADFTRALELFPGYTDAYINRGAAFWTKKDGERAVADFSRALAQNPNYIQAYFNRGVVYTALNQPDRAVLDFTLALRLRPNYPEAYYRQGMAYWKKGDTNSALSSFTRAVQLRSDYAQAYLDRGRLYQELGRTDLANADFNQARQLNPNLAPGR